MNSKYDIVVVVKNEGTHIYKDQTLRTVNEVMEAMDKDRVFGLNDKEMRFKTFQPNEVSKLQFNLVESWGR